MRKTIGFYAGWIIFLTISLLILTFYAAVGDPWPLAVFSITCLVAGTAEHVAGKREDAEAARLQQIKAKQAG